MTHHLLLKTANTLVYLFFLGANLYTVFGPGDEKIWHDRHPTYLTPASWIFGLWHLTHILFGGFVIWQWLPDTDEVVVHSFGGWFALAGLLSAIQLTLWKEDLLVLSLIVLLFATGAVTAIYHNLTSRFVAETLVQKVFVHGPVSLFHAWLVFVFWLNVMSIFTTVQDPANPDFIHVLIADLILLKLSAVGIGYTEYRYFKRADGDFIGTSAIALSLIAVGAHQAAFWIKFPAFALGIYTLGHAIFRPVQYYYIKSQGTTEGQPLLGGAHGVA